MALGTSTLYSCSRLTLSCSVSNALKLFFNQHFIAVEQFKAQQRNLRLNIAMGGDSKRTTFSSRRDTYWLRKSLHETFVLYGLKLLRETPMTHVSVPRKIGVFDGRDVFEVELISQTGVEISLINYAALIRDWKVPLKGERKRSIVCGFDNFEDYPLYSPYFGAIIGRVANRIGGSKFKIDGKEYALAGNEGKNHLHGGPRGLGRQVIQLILKLKTTLLRFGT